MDILVETAEQIPTRGMLLSPLLFAPPLPHSFGARSLRDFPSDAEALRASAQRAVSNGHVGI